MKSNKKSIKEICSYSWGDFSKAVTKMKNVDDLENLLKASINECNESRILRVYSRYSMVRRGIEKKMVKKRQWD